MLISRRLKTLLSNSLSSPSAPGDTVLLSTAGSSSPLATGTPRIVMSLLTTTSGNLLSASTASAGGDSGESLAPAVSRLSQASLATTAARGDLLPKPRVYAAFAAGVWGSYRAALATTDEAAEWIAVEADEAVVLVHVIAETTLLVLVGSRTTPSGVLLAKASSLAALLRTELKGFSAE
ncbi:uncharacterized protein V1510DRAFT_415692 [Dipodascopsis tothii]|uniref:uncharacterized protein n=1 Tax=Dipodascopsis tothii TaxID=44089 RepID=UPI0034CDA6C4